MSETIALFEATRLARNYPLRVRWSDEDQVFVGSIPAIGQEPAARFCRKSQKRTDQITRILATLGALGHIA